MEFRRTNDTLSVIKFRHLLYKFLSPDKFSWFPSYSEKWDGYVGGCLLFQSNCKRTTERCGSTLEIECPASLGSHDAEQLNPWQELCPISLCLRRKTWQTAQGSLFVFTDSSFSGFFDHNQVR